MELGLPYLAGKRPTKIMDSRQGKIAQLVAAYRNVFPLSKPFFESLRQIKSFDTNTAKFSLRNLDTFV